MASKRNINAIALRLATFRIKEKLLKEGIMLGTVSVRDIEIAAQKLVDANPAYYTEAKEIAMKRDAITSEAGDKME